MISFVLAADTDAERLVAAIVSLDDAIDGLEQQGLQVEVMIVPLFSVSDETQAILLAVEGARLLAPRRNVAMAWQSGLEAASEKLVWLGTTLQKMNSVEFVGATQTLVTEPAHHSEDGWLLAHKGALIATGGPGRFGSHDDLSELTRTLSEHMPKVISPNWGAPGHVAWSCASGD